MVYGKKKSELYMCHKCAKEFLHSNFNQAVTDNKSIFPKIVPNFTYSQKIGISKAKLKTVVEEVLNLHNTTFEK